MRSSPVTLGSPACEQEAEWGEGWSPAAQPHLMRFLPGTWERVLGSPLRKPDLSQLFWSRRGLLVQLGLTPGLSAGGTAARPIRLLAEGPLMSNHSSGLACPPHGAKCDVPPVDPAMSQLALPHIRGWAFYLLGILKLKYNTRTENCLTTSVPRNSMLPGSSQLRQPQLTLHVPKPPQPALGEAMFLLHFSPSCPDTPPHSCSILPVLSST